MGSALYLRLPGFIGEYSSVSEVCAIVTLLEEFEYSPGMLVAAANISAKGSMQDLRDTLDSFQGCGVSAVQYVEDYAW